MPARSARSGARGKRTRLRRRAGNSETNAGDQREPGPGDQLAASRRRRRAARPAGSSTARKAGCGSTSGCSSWPRTSTVPLLERVRFLVHLRQQPGRVLHGPGGRPDAADGGRAAGGEHQRADVREILQNTLETARELALRHAEAFAASVLPALSRARASRSCAGRSCPPASRTSCSTLFRDRIYPVLTPLVVDPAHPFPYISGPVAQPGRDDRRPADRRHDVRPGQGAAAAAPVPRASRSSRFVPLEDVIAAHLGELFVGLDVLEHHAFRVTRTRDLEIDEDVTENLLQSLERELQRRRFEPAGPAGGGGVHLQRRARPAGHRAGIDQQRGVPAARPAGPVRPDRRSPTWTCGS